MKNFKELILPNLLERGRRNHPTLGKDEFFKTKINSLPGQELANLMPFHKPTSLTARIKKPGISGKSHENSILTSN
jgi:hypothetical protein